MDTLCANPPFLLALYIFSLFSPSGLKYMSKLLVAFYGGRDC